MGSPAPAETGGSLPNWFGLHRAEADRVPFAKLSYHLSSDHRLDCSAHLPIGSREQPTIKLLGLGELCGTGKLLFDNLPARLAHRVRAFRVAQQFYNPRRHHLGVSRLHHKTRLSLDHRFARAPNIRHYNRATSAHIFKDRV